MFRLSRFALLVRQQSTLTSSAEASLQAAMQVRTALDAGSVGAAVGQFRALDAAGRARLSTEDGERLLVAVAAGAGGVHGAAQRALVGELFALFPHVAAPGRTAVLETRAAAGDVAGAARVVAGVAPDVAAPLVAEAFARAGDFGSAAAVLRAFVRRHYGAPKPPPDEMLRRVAAAKDERDRAHALRRRAVEERVIRHLDGAAAAAAADASAEKPLPQRASLLDKVLALLDEKPAWKRHPPLPRDASPAMIKKRTRPAAENPNALLLTTYNNLLKAYVSTNNKEATLDLLALIKEFIPLTKIAPNFTSYSIAMTPFVNTGDYTAVQKLFNEAAETSGRVPSINLSTRILAAIVKANNVEAGKLEIEAIQKRHADVAPTKSLLREMMRVYALDSETGTNAPEAWGIIKTLIQSAKSNDTPLEEIYDYSAELALANGPLQRGKELSTWDAWFDGIGKFAPRLKYATGMIGYAAIPSTASSTETFQKFLEAFDAAVVDPEDRRVEYGKVLKNLMAGNNILEAALFFESARVKGVEFGATGYSAMVSGLLKSDIDSKETLLLGLVDRMKANGFKEQFLLHNLTKHLGPSSPVVLAYSNAVQQEAAV